MAFRRARGTPDHEADGASVTWVRFSGTCRPPSPTSKSGIAFYVHERGIYIE